MRIENTLLLQKKYENKNFNVRVAEALIKYFTAKNRPSIKKCKMMKFAILFLQM